MSIIEGLAIVAFFIFIVVVIIFGIVFYKMIYSNLTVISKKDTNHVSVRVTIPYDTAIDKILYLLRIEVGSVDAYLARFHNGGNFNNGTKMQKFSITHWKAASSIELLQHKFYDIFVSHYPDVMDHLIMIGEYCCADLNDCKDSNFRKDMQSYGFKSVDLFLICQDDAARTPEGFVALNFNETHIMTKENRDKIKYELPRLLGLMNLITDRLKQ